MSATTNTLKLPPAADFFISMTISMATKTSSNQTRENSRSVESLDLERRKNRCYEEIEKYIKERDDAGDEISFAHFVNDMREFIIENSPGIIDYKFFWSHLFGKAVNKLSVATVKRRANWESIKAELDGESGSSSTTSSASETNSGTPLSTEEKEFVNEMYTTKLKYPKWELATGKIVEDTMYEFVKQCLYEHSSHSLILDIMDPCWIPYFTIDEIKEIRTFHKPELQPLPSKLKEYLDKFSGVCDLEELIDIHMHNRFHPSKVDLHWIEKTIGDILDLYYYQYDFDNKTEADAVRRLWGFIEKCYDESKFYVISGEKVIVSSSNRMNEERSIPGVTPLLRKKAGTKVDILIKHLHDDFGVGEAGLHGGAMSTKYITEASLKLPKSMKDITWNLLKKVTKDTQHLRIPGFIINGTELTVKLMDIPKGNVCRVYTLGPMPFPLTPDTFYKDLVPLITLVWQCKTLLKETLQFINTDNNVFIPTIDDPVPTSTIPACIPSPRKRKLSNIDND